MSDDSPSERTLLARLKGGDHAAFTELARVYLDALLRYTYGIVRSREAAEDIVQDVFAWLWEHHATIGVRESVRDYLFSAARHRALNALRGRRSGAAREGRYVLEQGDDSQMASPDDPEGEAERHELADAIQRAIDQLPERRREIMLLRWRQLSSREIAEVLGISVKTVEAQITSAYAALRVVLEGWRPPG